MPESPNVEPGLGESNRPPQIVKPDGSSSSVTITDVFHLGLQFEYLRDIVNSDNRENRPSEEHVIEILENIESSLANQNTRGVVSELVSKQQQKIKNTKNSKEKITRDQAETLKKQVTSWIHLFSRDLANEIRIPAAGSGVLDLDVLIERPSELFNDEVWNWLDQRPKDDLKEACRSVAVGCATASVMLSLRAVEHCLREWYEQENESLDAAWGRVLDQLMEEYAEEDKRNDTVLTQLSDLPPVLTTLYYLKEKRNEVNHPEESPTAREARRTLLIVSSTITEIYSVMKDEALEEGRNIMESESSTFEEGLSAFKEPQLNDTEEKVLHLINEMEKENEDPSVPRGSIIDAATDMGLVESEVDSILQNLLMSGKIYEPDADSVKTI